MAILNILTYPEKSLLQPSVKVETIDDELKKLIEDMGETMFDAPGVGLAAPQVGVNKRVIVYDSNAGMPAENPASNPDENPVNNLDNNPVDGNPVDDGSENEFSALINPEIIASSGSIISEKEGCLSVTDYTADVKRYETVTVKALDIDGNEIEFVAEGMPAVIMQHEIDHLDGILFIERLSLLKRTMYKKRIKKQSEAS